jgi:hypothetical protein
MTCNNRSHGSCEQVHCTCSFGYEPWQLLPGSYSAAVAATD